MKRFISFVFILIVSLAISGCMKENARNHAYKPELPKEADEFGLVFAEQLNYVAKQLKKNNVDYLNPDEMLANIEKYAVEIANRQFPDKPTTVEELRSEMARVYSKVQEALDGLTPGQLEYLHSVSQAQASSRTTREFFLKLNEINKTISALPEIEQRRLYNASAAFFHLYNEATTLINEGYFPVKSDSPKYLRSRSVDDEYYEFTIDVDITECPADDTRGFTSFTYNIPNTRGAITVGVMASFIISISGTTIVAAVSAAVPVVLIAVTVYCVASELNDYAKNREWCIDYYANHCIGGPCGDCLQYCIVQRALDPRCQYD